MRWPSHIVCIKETKIHINFGWNTLWGRGRPRCEDDIKVGNADIAVMWTGLR